MTFAAKELERFDEEFVAALAAITKRPESFPVFLARAGRVVRRCLLAKTRRHLYFEVFQEANEVWILAARGANQRGKPKLSG